MTKKQRSLSGFQNSSFKYTRAQLYKKSQHCIELKSKFEFFSLVLQ